MPELPTLPPIAAAPVSVVLLDGDGSASAELIAKWTAFLATLERPIEIILVSFGGRGGDAADSFSERHPEVRVLRLGPDGTEGAALAAGLSDARHPLVAYCAAEPRYQPADLAKLLHEIDKVHVVSGCRGGRRAPLPVLVARLLHWVVSVVIFSYRPSPSAGWLGWKSLAGRWAVRALFGVHSKDVACPYRLLRREILARIPLQSKSSFARVELLAKANFLGHLIAEEVPLNDGVEGPVPTGANRERFADILADARRVFSHPDFGPAHLPPPPPQGEPAPGDPQPDAPQSIPTP
jgi:hypothetical protein